MDERERILGDNLKEYSESAEQALAAGKFNTSVTLFFKAIAAATDLFIFKKEGFVPSSHTQRFRIIQEKYGNLYKILDQDFPFYQDSYTKKMSAEAAEVLKDDLKTIKRMLEEKK